MPSYRVSKLLIRGMRSIDDLELDLADTNVLIGANGAGKTTIIEACELLRKAATERPFVNRLLEVHGGADALLRKGTSRLVLGAHLVGTDGSKLTYEASFARHGQWLIIDDERVNVLDSPNDPVSLLWRNRSGFSLHVEAVDKKQTIDPDELALTAAAYQLPKLEAVRAALASIEVHSAFDARALWTTGPAVELGLRATNIIRPALRVEPGGRNLPNIYHALRNQPDWLDTLARVQLALGERVEDVVIPADVSGGRIGLALRLKDIGEISSYSMSDGQLAYLALLGVLRLQRPVPPSLVAFDEPDLHLHPGLVRRLMSDLEVFGRTTTTIVATHSDAMLDALSEPARSAVLCELDENAATRCLRPDADELKRWLEDYRGIGELRSEGYEKVVFPSST